MSPVQNVTYLSGRTSFESISRSAISDKAVRWISGSNHWNADDVYGIASLLMFKRLPRPGSKSLQPVLPCLVEGSVRSAVEPSPGYPEWHSSPVRMTR